MRKTTQRRFQGLALAALLSVPATAWAQEPPPQQDQEEPPTQEEMVREVFQYPSFSRRNPFQPQSATSGGGPRYEQLTLTGILYDQDPTYSVASLTTGTVSVNPDGTLSASEGDAYNVKVGQRIGNTTIREIQRDRVIVDVEEFGLTDRRTMFLAARRQGGSQ